MTDYTIASKIVTPQVDPLALAGNLQNLQKGVLSNKLLGQNIEQTLAQRAAARGAVGEDGGFNVDRYEAALARGGADGPAIAQAQAIRQGQLENKIKSLGLSTAEMNLSAQELGNGAMVGQGILANGASNPALLTRDAVSQAIQSNLLATGLVKSESGLKHAQEFIATLTDDPKQNAALVQQWVNQSTDITKAMGAINQTDTGSNIIQQRINPATGVPTTVGVMEKGLSPSEENTPAYTYTDANGQQHIVTKAQAAAAGGAGTAPEGIVSGAGAGVLEAKAAAAKASSDQFTADVNDSGGFTQRIQGLNNAEAALRKAQTGKGAQAVQDWKALVATIAPSIISEADKAKIKDFDEAKKYLTDYANRRGAALGMGTDAGREMIHAANPSVDINQAAATDILKVIKGLERMQNAQVAIAQAEGVTPDRYSSWRAGWNRSINPAGFMADQITAAERKKAFDAMSKADQAKYAKAVKAAVQAGYFTLDDLRK